MSDQLTIRLPEDLSQALEAASVRLLGLAPDDERAPSDRVQHLIGSLETGIPGLAENHRAYTLDSLSHGK